MSGYQSNLAKQDDYIRNFEPKWKPCQKMWRSRQTAGRACEHRSPMPLFYDCRKIAHAVNFFLRNQKWRLASLLLSESLRKFYWFGLLGRGTPFSGLRAAFFSQRNLQPFLRMFVGARENCRFYFWLFSGRENCPLVDRSRFPEEWKAGKRG